MSSTFTLSARPIGRAESAKDEITPNFADRVRFTWGRPSVASNVRSLGADEAVEYRAARPAELGPFDVIFDTVGSDLPAWRRLLAPPGKQIIRMG